MKLHESSSALHHQTSELVWLGDGHEGYYNNRAEPARLLTRGLVCLCRSRGGISIKLRLFHNQLRTSCSIFIWVSDTVCLPHTHSPILSGYCQSLLCFLCTAALKSRASWKGTSGPLKRCSRQMWRPNTHTGLTAAPTTRVLFREFVGEGKLLTKQEPII